MNEELISNRQLWASFVRTLVPWLVGIIGGWAINAGLEIPNPLIEQGIYLVIAGVYYLIIRILESEISTKFSWLLGSEKQPEYSKPTDVPIDSMENSEPTEDRRAAPWDNSVKG